MTGKIRTLSELTINQIAAGEVIENPASVVKELIENAIDAGATRINIELLGGGLQLISVSDNGSGMNKEDALLCLQRHATSKITNADDLLKLTTMGFRGEALASIASISKTSLITAEEGSLGTQIDIEGGLITHQGPISSPRGTTIEARALFYNVPARKKFQKSIGALNAESTKIVTQQALAHPHVGIHLIVQNQPVFSTCAPTQGLFIDWLSLRSAELLGEHFKKNLIEVNLQHLNAPSDVCIKGLIGSPLTHRHNRSGQYLFVNKRPVISPLISYAIKDAYGTRIPVDRHPIFVLHLDIPSDRVDVNVHPQKTQIRLRDEQQMRSTIHTTIHQSLNQQTAIFRIIPQQPAYSDFPITTDFPNVFSESDLPPTLFQENLTSSQLKETPSLPLEWIDYIGVYTHYLLIDLASLSENPSFFEKFSHISQSKHGILMIDLQAASACITFDTLSKNKNAPSSQKLLIPETLSVSSEESLLIDSHQRVLQQLGFELHQCGKTTFLIESIPSTLDNHTSLELLKILIAAMPYHDQLNQLAITTSQFTSRRKKNFLLQEAKEIFEQFIQLSSPSFCPSGRLTTLYVSHDEIKQKFLSSFK